MLRLTGCNTRGKLTSRTSIGDRTVNRNGKSSGHNFVVSDNHGSYFWKTQAILGIFGKCHLRDFFRTY